MRRCKRRRQRCPTAKRLLFGVSGRKTPAAKTVTTKQRIVRKGTSVERPNATPTPSGCSMETSNWKRWKALCADTAEIENRAFGSESGNAFGATRTTETPGEIRTRPDAPQGRKLERVFVKSIEPKDGTWRRHENRAFGFDDGNIVEETRENVTTAYISHGPIWIAYG